MKVYRARDGWRWQLWRSSDIVAESGGAYENKGEAVKMAQAVLPPLVDLEVEDCEEDA
jgi:hypothetical protein